MLSHSNPLWMVAFSASLVVGCAGAPGAAPRDVPQTFSAESELHLGMYTTCIVDGGKPVCFAVDSSEGSYDKANTRRPSELGFLGTVKRFAFNGKYGCAITEDDGVACFEGSLGGDLRADREEPFIHDHLGPPVMIVAGGDGFTNFGCVADAEHRVDCFSNSLGPSPTALPAGTKLVQMSAGESHLCGVTLAGTVLCWGSNNFGEAGHEEARAAGNINDFYKKLLAKLDAGTLKAVKELVTRLERQTLVDARKADAVLKGALRTLDEGDEPSRNVTIRKAFEQYANIRRCFTLDPIAPGVPGADILFVRENVEDLYASIEHRLARNYPQALRHLTPEGCELICRAAFEAAVRDGRKKVMGLEKPNILKITGGLFKESFLKIARDYSKERLGERAIEANFMIIDDGLAAIAAAPERFDVVVTTNMFGDIGSDITAKVTGGVGLVSSNNTNPNNPRAVSMFETMGGTADDIAGQNKANPVALIDAAAEMLLHIGGPANIRGAELIKAGVLEVLADGHYVGDIKRGPFQVSKGKLLSGTREFASEIARKITELRALKAAQPAHTIKALVVARAEANVRPLFERALRSYEQYAADTQAGGSQWEAYVERNAPPNPTRANSKILGFDMFVDDSGLQMSFTPSGAVDEDATGLVPAVRELFERETGIDLRSMFNKSRAGSLQSIRSFGQYGARVMRDYLHARPDLADAPFGAVLAGMKAGEATTARYSDALKARTLREAVDSLMKFDSLSLKLVQAFYRVRAEEISPILREHGFRLLRITSRGTEIYPTMCDFEKRDVDRYRVEIDAAGPLVSEGFNHVRVQTAIMAVQTQIVARGWMISETMLNRSFIDGEGDKLAKEVPGVSRPYAMNLGTKYDQG